MISYAVTLLWIAIIIILFCLDKQFYISNYCAMQQIFTYIYHNYFLKIASTHVHACDALYSMIKLAKQCTFHLDSSDCWDCWELRLKQESASMWRSRCPVYPASVDGLIWLIHVLFYNLLKNCIITIDGICSVVSVVFCIYRKANYNIIVITST